MERELPFRSRGIKSIRRHQIRRGFSLFSRRASGLDLLGNGGYRPCRKQFQVSAERIYKASDVRRKMV
jgi:hypothetical protein